MSWNCTVLTNKSIPCLQPTQKQSTFWKTQFVLIGSVITALCYESNLPIFPFPPFALLNSLANRRGMDLNLKECYSEEIKNFSRIDISYKSKNLSFIAYNSNGWWVSHHPVLHPQKPGKMRRVLDGVAIF